MGKVVVVTGIPGVGKTTVLSELEKLASERGMRVKVVNFGTVMMELAKGAVPDRDQIRKMPLDFQRKLQRKAADKIAGEAEGVDVLIVDTHMFIRTRNGFWPGLPAGVLEKLSPSALVLVEASVKEVAERRAQDKTRSRDMVLGEEVKLELQASRSFATACSVLTGAPVKIVQNPAGGAREAAEELINLLRDIL